MAMFIEKSVGNLGDKRRWRQYKARVEALPASRRATVEELERYLRYFGVISKERDQSVSAIERGFYKEIERGINKERERLVKAIERAEAEDGGTRS